MYTDIGPHYRGMSFLAAMAAVLLIAAPALGANAWKESSSRFSMDLPKGWNLGTQETITEPDEIREKALQADPDADLSVYTDEDLTGVQYKFVNKKEEASVYMIFSPAAGGMTAGEMFKDLLDSLPDSGLVDIGPDGDVVDLEVNGKEARWGVYKGMIAGTTIPLYSFIGAVGLDKGTVNFMAVVSEGKRKKLAGSFEEMFLSIREVGATVTGAGNRRKAQGL